MPVSDVRKYGGGPVWIFNAADVIPGLGDQLTVEMGSRPERLVRGFGPGEGACEVFIFPVGAVAAKRAHAAGVPGLLSAP